MFSVFLFLLAGPVVAHPPLLSSRQGGFQGIATFNNYGAQGGTTCGPASGESGTYGAAASDISPDVSGGKCGGTVDQSQCSGQSPGAGFQAPQCPNTNCGKCYKVTNQGGVDGGQVGGVGNTITVQIIDSCPSGSAQNFCKTDVPANQRCSDPSTNQLDIDQSAYVALTGTSFGSGPTLNIGISPSCCPSESGCDVSGSSGSSGSASSAIPAGGAVSSETTSLPSNGNNPGTYSFLAQPPANGSTSTGTQKKCKRSKKKNKIRSKSHQKLTQLNPSI